MMSLSALRVGILGLGQIGGSIAAGLIRTGAAGSVAGFDLRPELRTAASDAGYITKAADSELSLIQSSDLLVIALPVGEILSFLRRHRNALLQKVAVTDTGSLKSEIMNTAGELGLNNFVGGHPLAGTQKRGVESWNSSLFESATYFLTKHETAGHSATDVVTALVISLGARPVPVDPARHDSIFATTSNLPHVFAYTLTRLFREIPTPDETKDLFRAPSFLSATRVTQSDPHLVFEMLWYNRDRLSVALAALLERLAQTRKALNDTDQQRFRDLLGLS